MRQAKQRDALCEVILITGYASVDTAVDALTLGAFDYVRKPLNDIFDIRRTAWRALERRRLAQENLRLVGDLQEKNQALELALADARALGAELIQSEKLAGIGTLAAGVAHEVASPLFGILGLAEAILDEDDPRRVRDHSREIVEYSENIKRIVHELTSYARTSEPDDDARSANVAEALDDAVRLLGRSTTLTGVALRVDVEAGLCVRIRGAELQQVFLNLLKNAAEAVLDHRGAEGGWIDVRAWADGALVHVRVQDNGPGIPAGRLGQVFDPFFTTKPPGRGTGLGLNVVYRIITRNSGQVDVESPPGEGARFRLRLHRA